MLTYLITLKFNEKNFTLKVYKALLFLGAGSVIHAVADNQDFRKYGGLRAFLPLTYSVMLIASLSLVAFPYMTGFYSKDFILESAYGQFYFSSIVVYFIASIGAIFTTLYSVKVLYLTFLANPLGPINSYKNAHEGDIYMSLPAEQIGKLFMWVRLPNSGEPLKLMIPSYIWKFINGWGNSSCKVISQEILRQNLNMGNRGSKSDFTFEFVKEQRINGTRDKFIISKVYSNRFWKIPLNQNPFINKLISFNSNYLIQEGFLLFHLVSWILILLQVSLTEKAILTLVLFDLLQWKQVEV